MYLPFCELFTAKIPPHAFEGGRNVFSLIQLEVVMLRIILLNVQTQRPVRKVINRCVPRLPEVIRLNVPVTQLVGVNA